MSLTYSISIELGLLAAYKIFKSIISYWC